MPYVVISEALANGGMETAGDWVLTGETQYSTVQHKAGLRSLSLSGNWSSLLLPEECYSSQATVMVPVQTNRAYTLSFWTYLDSALGVGHPLGVELLDSGPDPDLILVSSGVVPLGTTLGQWVFHEFRGLTFTRSVADLTFSVTSAPGHEGHALFYLDEVSLAIRSTLVSPENGPGPVEFQRSVMDDLSGILIKEMDRDQDIDGRTRKRGDVDDLGRGYLAFFYDRQAPKTTGEDEP